MKMKDEGLNLTLQSSAIKANLIKMNEIHCNKGHQKGKSKPFFRDWGSTVEYDASLYQTANCSCIWNWTNRGLRHRSLFQEAKSFLPVEMSTIPDQKEMNMFKLKCIESRYLAIHQVDYTCVLWEDWQSKRNN